MSKFKRQNQIEKILISNNKGWRQAELARMLGVHRSTVGRDFQEMTTRLPLYEKGGLMYVNHKAYQNNLQLNIHELLSLHMAGSCFLENDCPASVHLASVLHKVSDSLASHSEFVSEIIEKKVQEFSEPEFSQSKDNVKRQEKMNIAWVEGKKLIIHLQSAQNRVEKIKGFICSMEPDSSHRSLDVIFKVDGESQLRKIAISRITSLRLCDELVKNPQEWITHTEESPQVELVAMV